MSLVIEQKFIKFLIESKLQTQTLTLFKAVKIKCQGLSRVGWLWNKATQVEGKILLSKNEKK